MSEVENLNFFVLDLHLKLGYKQRIGTVYMNGRDTESK